MDNGSCKSIYKCKSKTCKLKSNFILRDNVVITSSKRIFDCEVPNETRYIDYNSPNVIYLFTWNRCPLYYVGESVQKLNKIFNWHRNGFKGFCCILTVYFNILIVYFNKGICCNASCSVQNFGKIRVNW